jgi:hypothetical protein
LRSLLASARIAKYLTAHFPEIFAELRRIADAPDLETAQGTA